MDFIKKHVVLFFFFFTPAVLASQIPYSIEALSDTVISSSMNEYRDVSYQIINHDSQSTTYSFILPEGVKEIHSASDECVSKHPVAAKSVCTKKFRIDMATFTSLDSPPIQICHQLKNEKSKTCQNIKESLAVKASIIEPHIADLSISGMQDLTTGQVLPIHRAQAACDISLFAGSNASKGFVIQNNSPVITAKNITAQVPWSDVTVDNSDCAILGPGQTCTITLTPSSTKHPFALVSVTGDNTTIATFNLRVLGIGDVYQGGQIYFIQSGTNTGLIVFPSDSSASIVWDYAPQAQPNIPGATSDTDGAGNTAAIVAQLTGIEGKPRNTYAAGLCDLLESNAVGGTPCSAGETCYTDWYLPASAGLVLLNDAITSEGNVFNVTPGDFYWGSKNFTPTTTPPGGNAAIKQSYLPSSTTVGSKTAEMNRVRCHRTFTG